MSAFYMKMTSPNSLTGANYETSRYNKGVEAKENDCLIGTVDSPKSCNGSLYTQVRNAINRLAENDDEDFSLATNASSAIGTEDSNSYLQVTIKKHHRKKELGRQNHKGFKKSVPHQSPPKGDKRRTLDDSTTTPSQASTPSKKQGNRVSAARNIESPKNKELIDNPAAPGLYVLTQPMILTPYPNYICPMPNGQGDGEKLEQKIPELKPSNYVTKLEENCNLDNKRVIYEDEKESEASLHDKGKQWLHDPIPKGVSESMNHLTDTKEMRAQLYHFDHGNRNYFSTTDFPPETHGEDIANRMEMAATKFWAEVFGMAYVAVAFVTTFFIQFERFILSGIIRPILVSFIQTLSDYLFKPFLAVLFNALIQPPLLFLYNVVASVCDLFKPVAKCMGYFVRELAHLLESFRLVSVKQRNVTSKV